MQRLVKEAKGAMHMHTQAGQGTTFTLYLPAAKGGEAQPAPAAGAPEAS